MPSQAEIDARLNRYALTLDARDLWPEVPAPAFRAAQAEIARAVAAALVGDRPVHLVPPAGVEAGAMGIAASAAGVGPLLGRWCEDGTIASPYELSVILGEQLEQGRNRASRLRGELDRVLAALARRGLEPVVLKGMHTGFHYFPEPGTRPAADIDLLVRPVDAAAARQVLTQLGFMAGAVNPDAGVHWRPPGTNGVHSLVLAHADDPWFVDLHVSLDRTLFPGLTARLGDVTELDREVLDGFTRPVMVLPQPLLFAFLALHASSHFYSITLVRLVELVLVARRDFAASPFRWSAFAELVRETDCARFVYPALALAEQLAPGTMHSGVLAEIREQVPRRVRRLVRRVTPATSQRLHPYPFGERFVWVATPGQWLAAAREVVWPRALGDAEGGLRRFGRMAGVQWRRIRNAARRLVG